MKNRLTLVLVLILVGSVATLGAAVAQDVPAGVSGAGDGYWECPIAPESIVNCSMAAVRGAALSNAYNGWAVGNNGLLLRYRNGQWSQVSRLPAYELNAIALRDVDNGWAVGQSSDGRGGLFRLREGHWSAVAPVTPSTLNSVALVGNNGWAVGDGGVTLFYDGVEWLGLSSPTTRNLNAVALTSASTGWAVGDNGTILRLNGSWSVAQSPTNQHLYGLALASDGEGWAVGYGGVLLRLNGGTWSVVSSPTNQPLRAVTLFDINRGWAVGDTGIILMLDGGAWTVSPNPRAGQPLYALATAATGEAWAFGYDSRYSHAVLLNAAAGGADWAWHNRPYVEPWRVQELALAPGSSTDGVAFALGFNGNYDSPDYNRPLLVRMSGGAWAGAIDLPGGGEISALALVDGANGWAVGAAGGIWRLAGGTWTREAASPTARPLYALDLADASNGWAAGNGGVILRLKDGTWSQVSSIGTEDLYAIALSGNTGYMVGASGVIARYVNVLGQWARVGSPTTNALRGVVLSGPAEGWAVGDNVTLKLAAGVWAVHSTQSADDVVLTGPDQGWAVDHYYHKIWRLSGGVWSTARDDLTASALALGGDGEGWAVTQDGRPLRLHGGQWYRLSPLSVSWTDVAITAPGEGWAVGNGGAIWRLQRGAWQPAYSPTTIDLRSVALSGPADGWAVGGSTSYPYPPLLLQLTQGVWRTVPTPEGVALLYDVALSGGAGWAVGEDTILRLSGGAWSRVTSSVAGYAPHAVALAGPNDGWAVAGSYYGYLLRLSGGNWTLGPYTYAYLNDVALTSASDGWAVGNQIWRLSGGAWAKHADSSSQLYGLALSSPASGWAVGYSGTIMRLSAGAWSAGDGPATQSLQAIALSGDQAGWSVGDNNTILRYCPQAGCADDGRPTPTPSATPTRVVFTPSAYRYLPLIMRRQAAVSVTPTATPNACERYEPNNTLSSAWGPLVNTQALDAALCSGDINDYYYVDVPATTLTLNLTNIPAGVDYDLFLYAQGGTTPLAESRNDGSTAERISLGVVAGRYYVRVNAYIGRSDQPYRLAATWGGAAAAPADTTPEAPGTPIWGKPPVDEPAWEEPTP